MEPTSRASPRPFGKPADPTADAQPNRSARRPGRVRGRQLNAHTGPFGIEELTGVLLVGGASVRFGSPKALARLQGETLAERAWRTLGEACDHRLAFGKVGDGLELPFPLLDDGSDERAAIIGLAAGLRSAPTDLCVVLPIDCPAMASEALLAIADGCGDGDAAVPQTGPLPGAYRKRALPALESGERSIRRALERLDVAVVELDPALLVNVNTPGDLRRLG